MTPDLLTDLGLTAAELQDRIFTSFVEGSLAAPSTMPLKRLAAARVPEIVQAAGAVAKAYLGSDAFKRRYAAAWSAQAPRPPALPKTFEQSLNELRAQLDRQIAEMQASIENTLASTRARIETQIRVMESDFEEHSREVDPTSFAEAEQDRYATEMEAYKPALAEYETRRPKDPDELVRRRLKAFLDETADVQFDAALTSKDGRTVFVDERLEGKSRIWKMCFRAGQPATDAARAFAQAWLNEP